MRKRTVRFFLAAVVIAAGVVAGAAAAGAVSGTTPAQTVQPASAAWE